eukprot:scaffold4623_cov171-Amphora_coffeaeformis.AAC.1
MATAVATAPYRCPYCRPPASLLSQYQSFAWMGLLCLWQPTPSCATKDDDGKIRLVMRGIPWADLVAANGRHTPVGDGQRGASQASPAMQ